MIQVRSRRPFDADPEAVEVFTGPAGDWLPEPARLWGPDTWLVLTRAGPIHRQVAVTVGRVWRHGETAWRALRWEPLEDGTELVPLEGVLPVFVGEIGLVQHGDAEAELRVRGTYAPPFGVAGALADHAVMHRVAQRTVDRLLEDIVRRLGAPRAHTAADEGPVGSRTVGPTDRAPRP